MGGVLGALTVDRGWRSANPAITTASTFRTVLRRAGVTVPGAPISGTAPDDGDAGRHVRRPGRARRSPSGSSLPSDNFVAEILMKGLVVGRRRRGRLPACAGLAAVRDWRLPPTDEDQPCTHAAGRRGRDDGRRQPRSCAPRSSRSLGVTPQIHDGSGLTRRNRVSPALVARLLVAAARRPGPGPGRPRALPRAGRHRHPRPADARHGRAGTLPRQDRHDQRRLDARRLLHDRVRAASSPSRSCRTARTRGARGSSRTGSSPSSPAADRRRPGRPGRERAAAPPNEAGRAA